MGLARPSVCLSVPYGLLAGKHKGVENQNRCECFPSLAKQVCQFLAQNVKGHGLWLGLEFGSSRQTAA